MERIDGYLCIDDCEKILVDRDKGQWWVYINGEEYFFKPCCSLGGYNELIAYYAAKILEIDACFYDLAVLNGECGYISKSLRGKNIKLIPGSVILGEYLVSSLEDVKKMGLDNVLANEIEEEIAVEGTGYFSADYVNNLEVIRHALEYRYEDKINIRQLMDEFILMYIYTVVMGDVDKHPGNWLLIESSEGVRLAPLFDNEIILNDIFKEINYSVSFYDYNCDIFCSLTHFLENYGLRYCDLFVGIFERLKNNFNSIFERIEEQIGVEFPFKERDRLLDKFNRHAGMINRVIFEYKKKGLKKVLSKSNVVNL